MQKIEDVILFQLDLTNKVAKQYSQKEFDRLKLGITVEQWVVLKIVSENLNLLQNELATKSYRDPASITRTIDLLVKKELILREAIPNDRRAYNITLTKKGQLFIKQHFKIIKKHRELSIKGLSEHDLTTLNRILAKIRTNME